MIDDEYKARLVRAMAQMVQDSLALAASIAFRAGEQFNGEQELILFSNLGMAILKFRDCPEMKAVQDAGITEAMLKGGRS